MDTSSCKHLTWVPAQTVVNYVYHTLFALTAASMMAVKLLLLTTNWSFLYRQKTTLREPRSRGGFFVWWETIWKLQRMGMYLIKPRSGPYLERVSRTVFKPHKVVWFENSTGNQPMIRCPWVMSWLPFFEFGAVISRLYDLDWRHFLSNAVETWFQNTDAA